MPSCSYALDNVSRFHQPSYIGGALWRGWNRERDQRFVKRHLAIIAHFQARQAIRLRMPAHFGRGGERLAGLSHDFIVTCRLGTAVQERESEFLCLLFWR